MQNPETAGNHAVVPVVAAGMDIVTDETSNPLAAPVVLAAPSTVVIDTKTTRTRSKTTIQRQIKTNAMKYLMEEANKEFKITGIYTLPTEEKIGMECKKRWLEHEERGKAKEDVSSYFN